LMTAEKHKYMFVFLVFGNDLEKPYEMRGGSQMKCQDSDEG